MPTPLSFRSKIRKSLFDLLSRDEFALLLKDDLQVIYDDIVTKGMRELEFDEAIESLDRRDRLPELFLAAIKARPENKALADLNPIVEIVTAHSKAVEETKGQSDSEAAPTIAALPPATGLQASVVAASIGEQTISLSLARTKQDEARRRICVIEVSGQSVGTGFLVGRKHVLTNRHVLDKALALNAANILAVFDHSGDQEYKNLPRKRILLDASSPMDEVTLLDYAVLQLESEVEADRGFFSACPIHVRDKSSITIFGHPVDGTTALGLQYSWGMIRDINDQAKRIAYTAQTSPGSSGSPIFNANFELVGLHHHGQAGVNNHGIPIWAIAKSLKDKGHPELLPLKSKYLPTGDETIEPDSPVVPTPPGDDPAFPTPVTPDARIATELGQELFLAKTERDLQRLANKAKAALSRYPNSHKLMDVSDLISQAMSSMMPVPEMSPVPTVRWKVASIWKKLPRYSSVAIATIAIAASLLFYVTMTQTTKLVPIHLEVATGPTIPEMGKDFMELRSTKKYEWVYRLETGPFNRRTENTTFLLSSTNNKVELEVRGCVIGGATAKRKSELTIKPGDKSAPIVQLEPTGTIEVDDRLFLLIGVKNHPADDPKFRSSFQLESK